MEEKKKDTHKGLTEARKRANKKYIDKFVEVKVRMFPERRVLIQQHAAAMGESTTAFVNRAIDEAMPETLRNNKFFHENYSLYNHITTR